jgi:hypothetical protein
MSEQAIETCAYRRCKERFSPKTLDHRFCSQRCRDDYHYDVRRAEIGAHRARRRRLAIPLAGCMENGQKTTIETILCKLAQPPLFAVPRDVLGRGHRWPNTPPVDPRVLASILWREAA